LDGSGLQPLNGQQNEGVNATMKVYRWSGVVDSRYKVKATTTNSDEKLENYSSIQEPISTISMTNGILHKCISNTAFTVYIMDGEKTVAFIHAYET
jgi:hypothetical protein